MLLEPAGAHGVEEAERADAVHIGGVLRHLEGHLLVDGWDWVHGWRVAGFVVVWLGLIEGVAWTWHQPLKHTHTHDRTSIHTHVKPNKPNPPTLTHAP